MMRSISIACENQVDPLKNADVSCAVVFFQSMIRKRLFKIIVSYMFGILYFSIAQGAESKSVKLLGIYQVKLNKYENLIVSQSSQFQTAVLTSRHGKNLIVAKEHVPQSIRSVRLRAREDNVSVNLIRTMKWKDKALFYYEAPQEFHVYSTLGGHLVISKTLLPKFDFSKLSLLKKPNKKVASL